MGRTGREGNDIVALDATVKEQDSRISEAARIVAGVARTKLIPPAGDAADDEAAGEIAESGASLAKSFVSIVNHVAKRIDDAMAPLEEVAQPTFRERLAKALHRALSLRPGGEKRTPATALSQALADADTLWAMLSPHRERLTAARHSIEADLVELAGHRTALVDNLLVEAKRQGLEVTGAAARVEDYLQTIQTLLVEINRQVADTNVLLNKLTIESERGILLTGLLSSGTDDGPPIFRERESLPHLAPLVDLYEKDMLASQEIDRRKSQVDARFAEHFGGTPAMAAGSAFESAKEPEVNHA